MWKQLEYLTSSHSTPLSYLLQHSYSPPSPPYTFLPLLILHYYLSSISSSSFLSSHSFPLVIHPIILFHQLLPFLLLLHIIIIIIVVVSLSLFLSISLCICHCPPSLFILFYLPVSFPWFFTFTSSYSSSSSDCEGSDNLGVLTKCISSLLPLFPLSSSPFSLFLIHFSSVSFILISFLLLPSLSSLTISSTLRPLANYLFCLRTRYTPSLLYSHFLSSSTSLLLSPQPLLSYFTSFLISTVSSFSFIFPSFFLPTSSLRHLWLGEEGDSQGVIKAEVGKTDNGGIAPNCLWGKGTYTALKEPQHFLAPKN